MGNHSTVQATSTRQDNNAVIRRILSDVRQRLEATTFDLICLATAIDQGPDAIRELDAEIVEWS